MRPDLVAHVVRRGVAALGEAAAVLEHGGGLGRSQIRLNGDKTRGQRLQAVLVGHGEQASELHERLAVQAVMN